MQFIRKNYLFVLPLLVIVLLSTYRILSFYFWHDDFSWFYVIRNGACFTFWPYNTFCSYLKFIYIIFGYHAFWYYLAGIVLLFFTTLCLYVFSNLFFDRKTSFLLSAIFSSVYIGSGTFLEAHSAFLVLTPLLFLLISLIIFRYSVSNKIQPFIFLLGTVIFALSVFIAPLRSASHIFPVIVFVLLFFNKNSLKRRIFLIVFLTIVYYFSFIFFPLGGDRNFLGIGDISVLSKVEASLKTIGGFVITDDVQNLILNKVSPSRLESIREVIGICLGLFVSFNLIIKNKKQVIQKITIFSLVWIIFFYLPYGLRWEGRIPSDHRYLFSMLPGVVLLWGTFSKYKLWKLITVIIIFVGIVQSNIFFNAHRIESAKRENFYSQMRNLIDNIPESAIIFVDTPQQLRSNVSDYFRVGYFPSEASLGTEYAIDFSKIKLFLDSDSFEKYFSLQNKETDKLYTLYYDGQKLINTTKDAREVLINFSNKNFKAVNKSEETKFTFDEQFKIWKSINNGLDIPIEQFKPLVPYTLSLEIVARTPQIPLPYSLNCSNCAYDPDTTRKVFEYIAKSREIEKNINIAVSNSGENTTAQDMIDGTEDTYWLADRQKWFAGEKPLVTINLKKKTEIDGLVISSLANIRKPQNMEIVVDGKKVDFEMVNINEKGLKIRFKDTQFGDTISIKITSTNGDAPGMTEISFIPRGYSDVDMLIVDKFINFSEIFLKQENERKVFGNYLKSEATACVEWTQEGYGKGRSYMNIYPDGYRHVYSFRMPAMGINVPKFHLGCLDYPVDIEIHAVKTNI